MNRLMIGLAAAFLGFAALPGGEAKAIGVPQQIEGSSLVEQAQCRVERIRTVRPNGRVVYRTVRRCSPRVYRGPRYERCRTIRERVVRPNGSVVYRTIRRCR